MNSQSKTRFHQYSSYCPDDKDIYDYLTAKAPPTEKLLQYLRARGIFTRNPRFSDKNTLIEYLSTLPIDWQSFDLLTDLVEIRDTSEKITSETITLPGGIALASEAIKEIEELRHLRDNETYRLVAHSKESLTYEIDYVETESKYTRLIQRRPKTIQLTAVQTGDELVFRFSNVDRGLAIFDSIKGKLAEYTHAEGKPELASSNISFEGILSPKLRVKFFDIFTKNIEGFSFVTVSNVRIDRLPKSLRDKIEEEELGEDQDEAPVYAEEEEKIKRVILKGRDLTLTSEFKKFTAQGFFITSVSWTSEDESTNEHIHLSAGFQIPDIGLGFEYKIRGKTVISETTRSHERVAPTTADNYYLKIENAAEKALQTIRREAKQ